MNYDEAKLTAEKLTADAKRTGDILRGFPRAPSSGLVSDVTRSTSEYRSAKAAFDNAFAKLRAFNGWFTRTFKLEIREERRLRGVSR